jgi:hypothetical protein
MPKTIISKLQENPNFLKSANSRRPAKRKVKFKKVTFKITEGQKKALEIMCKRQKTTPVRYLKSIITNQTARYKASPQPVSYVTENQLQLFDLEKDIVPVKKKNKLVS